MSLGSGSGGGGNGGSSATAGPELEQIETEQVAFQLLSGEDKLRLLPTPWPSDSLPPPTSSLLSIASTKGLVAAAGPETLVIASTESLRQAYLNDAAESKVKSFTPLNTLPIARPSQVYFSSDESCLVVSSAQAGGLAVYDSNAISTGGQAPAFQVATEGQGVRQLLPNPSPAADTFGLFAVVTDNGQLLLADLRQQKLVPGAKGSAVLHEQVSCACWSRLGKQLIAGLADGTAVQFDTQGNVKATIPSPPQLADLKDPNASAYPITSIYWLETHDFLIIHTPINQPDSGAQDDSIYHLAHRDKASPNTWTFSKFDDPCPPFGLDRKPAHHFILRLRDWLSLSDSLILASTASAEIGLFTRSQTPLDAEQPVTDTFTYTQPPDSRRAAMPFGDEGDTSPIGMAIDLSAKEKAPRPIPTDEELDESPVPLPALCVLDQEGMLRVWWIVYNESIRKAEPFADLVAAGGPRALSGDVKQQVAPPSRPTTSSSSGFGAPAQQTSSFGQPSQPSSTFGQPSQPSSAFGQSSQSASAFGKPALGAPSTPSFGSSSFGGQKQSPWGSAAPAASSPGTAPGGSQFGKPSTFGSPSTFGQVGGGMGATKTSVWGTPSSQQPQSPSVGGAPGVFGGNAAQKSPFMNLGGQSKPSGFAALGGEKKEDQSSPFANKPVLSAEPSGSTVSFGNGSSFGSGSGSTNFGVQSFDSRPSPFVGAGGGPNSGFGKITSSKEETMNDDTTSETSTLKPDTENKAPFGLGAGGFKLGSTFQGDGTAKDDLPKSQNPGAGMFGKDFGSSLGLDGEQKAPDGGEDAAWWSGTTTPASNQAIKKEPESDEDAGKGLRDIPPAKSQENAGGDAPLPPDPATWQPKPGALPPPVPPGFGEDFAAPKSSQRERKASEKPVAGSPPVDLGGEKFSEGARSEKDDDDDEEAAGPPESDDDGEDWSDEEEDGEDEDQEHPTPDVTDQKALSAFESRLTPASPNRNEPPKQQDGAESTTPATEKKESYTPATDKKDSYTPAGFPKAPVTFAPPQRKGQESPRSPSPIRSATSPVRQMPSFGSTAQQPLSGRGLALPPQQPGQGSSLFGSGQQQQPPSAPQLASSQLRKSSQSPNRPQQPQPPQRIAVPPAQLVHNRTPSPAPSAKATEPEDGELEDEEDARIQSILSAPIEPTKNVPAFLAHQDYVASGAEKSGLGGQIERVYRDINSMVDTLALNARSLQGFVQGNAAQHNEGQAKDRLDLEDEESWPLGEGQELDGILEGIDIELEDGKIEDVRSALEVLQLEREEMSRLRIKGGEMRRQIAARSDPDQLAQQHAAPLPLESQAQQAELRHGVQRVQRLMAQAEESLSVFRAELASLPQHGQLSDGRGGMPTVEAVTNTILKMTAMVEKKSGDIDVLESQIRRLGGVGGLQPNYEADLAASMRASRLSNSSPLALRSSRISAYGSPATSRKSPARRALFDVSEAEVEAYRVKREAKRTAMERLQEQLEARGPRVVKVE